MCYVCAIVARLSDNGSELERGIRASMVAWLYLLRVGSLLRACEDHLSVDYTHHKARLIKVVCVFVCDAVLLLCLPY
jgi:hypothetical protein